MGGSVLRRSGNGAMHSPLGTTACLPLFSQITKIWSDMWVIDELVGVG